MKRILFLGLCLLLMASVSWGYSASGRVYQAGQLPLANPIGTISYPTTAGVPTNSWAGDVNGFYSTGWSSASLIGKQMTVTAYDQLPNPTRAASRTWKATSNKEKGKNITTKVVLGTINPNLICTLEPIALEVQDTPQLATAMLRLTSEATVPVMVDEFTAVLKCNNDKVILQNAQFAVDSFFDITYEINIPEPGAITVHGAATITPGVEFMPGVVPRPIFDVNMICPFIDSRDLAIVELELVVNTPAVADAVTNEAEILIGPIEHCSAYFLVDVNDQWVEALGDGRVSPMSPVQWNGIFGQWQDPFNPYEGEPLSPADFQPPTLYVYPGDDTPGGDPNDAGLVMKWGEDSTPDGNYTAAWKYDYLIDPDYSNATISVTVTAPQTSPNPPHMQINQVSIGLQNIPQTAGPIRMWTFSVGTGMIIPWNTPTTIVIDCSKTGITAATPTASGYLNNAGFDVTKVQWMIVAENAQRIGGPVNAPPPGGGIAGAWNYWHNLMVTPNVGGGNGSGAVNSKWFVKYAQPPEIIDVNATPPMINGWDEVSNYNHNPTDPIMADDWECKDERPVTDVHWWGSFKGWTQPIMPPIVPIAFHLGIWTDVPAGIDLAYSHPGQMIWENVCDSSVWNFAGYDVDPRIGHPDWQENEACFQFAQFLSQDEWFHQEPMENGSPNVYWLSIAPIYAAGVNYNDPNFYPWGWKTRPHVFNDDAVRITATDIWPPVVGSNWAAGTEVKGPIANETDSWDLAFELTTNAAAYIDDPIEGDISGPANEPDGVVNMYDMAKIADNWMETSP